MIKDTYPFIFQMNDYYTTDPRLEYTMQYRFKSTKSKHTYIVRVERYVEHAYCVKFFDKANMLSDNKFSLRTGTFEPRRIVSTVFNVMFDVRQRDPKASFFFLGAEDERDVAGRSTRRYNFYADFVLSTISTKVFDHHSNDDLSLYILVNRAEHPDPDDSKAFADRITAHVAQAMLGH